MRTPVVLSVVFVSSISIAQSSDIPLSNSTVPPYRGTTYADGGLSIMTDVTPGNGFVGVAPCRLVDTRQAGFPAGYGTPGLTGGVPRNFDLNSDPLCPGIPAGVDAYSLNITVTNTQGPGFILIYPQGGVQPTVSTVNYVANQTIANAAVVPAGTGGGVTVIAGVSGTNLIIDINGYFTDQYNAGVSFHAVSNSVAPAILAENTSTAATAVALQAVITSTSAGDFATAIAGRTNGNGYGVHGSSANGYGVLAGGGAGGVWASTDGPVASGVYGQHTGSGNGVFGRALATTGTGKGVYGETASLGSNAAGVFGTAAGLVPQITASPAGVRGESNSYIGVLGVSNSSVGVSGVIGPSGSYGVAGQIVGGPIGVLGYGGFEDYGVYSVGNAHVTGNLTVGQNFSSANKWFVEPHPHDASKEIRYVSLEGPYAEVYFRGTAQSPGASPESRSLRTSSSWPTRPPTRPWSPRLAPWRRSR